ncbi:MAG: phage antirepressor N-terminal domain-containing protein, partial [Phaeobacter italicus]
MDRSALPVEFHGTTLHVVEHNGEPFTALRPVVSGMGLDWKSQLAKLRANEGRWSVVIIPTETARGPRNALCMPVRKLPAFLASLSARAPVHVR